jgi:D-citramalate synthase
VKESLSKRNYDLGLDKGYDDKIEVLTFVDGGLSIEWMKKQVLKFKTYTRVTESFNALKKLLNNISRNCSYYCISKESGIETNVYLEDWSNGMQKLS